MFHRLLVLLLVHCEHPLGHGEAAEDVDAGEYNTEQSEPLGSRRSRSRRGNQRADNDDRGNRVGHRHQRRVQRRRDRPDDIIADETGQYED